MALESAAPMPMDLSLAVLGDAGPQSFSTQELFGGKRSIIVGVAGAFEPKSTKELEALMGKLLDLRANGAELVACVSVNDPWVVKAWAKSEGVGSGNSTVQMLADGDGSFTRALGFMADEDALLGARSKSYAVVLDEKGTCEYMVMESDGMADSVLGHLEFLKGTGAVPTILSSKAAELASKMRVDGERAQAAMAAAYDKARSETVELGRVKNDFIAKLEMAGRQATVRLKTMGDMGLAAFMASGANATEEDAQATLNQLAADRLASGQKPDSLPEEVFLRTAPMNLAKRNAIEANRKQWGIGADPAKPQRIDVNLKWDTSSSMQAPPTPADTAAAAAASSSSSSSSSTSSAKTDSADKSEVGTNSVEEKEEVKEDVKKVEEKEEVEGVVGGAEGSAEVEKRGDCPVCGKAVMADQARANIGGQYLHQACAMSAAALKADNQRRAFRIGTMKQPWDL